MANEGNLREELIKQMDKDFDEASNANVNSRREIIEKLNVQVKRLKWITAFSWLVVVAYFIGMHFLKGLLSYMTEGERWLVLHSNVGLLALVIIAVLLTFSIYAKSRTLNIRQIHIRLANIEELLKKISQDK